MLRSANSFGTSSGVVASGSVGGAFAASGDTRSRSDSGALSLYCDKKLAEYKTEKRDRDALCAAVDLCKKHPDCGDAQLDVLYGMCAVQSGVVAKLETEIAQNCPGMLR